MKLKDVAISSAIATVSTTVATALLGELENRKAAGPLNATSHIVWGDEAARHDEIDAKHTATGAVLNASAMMAWAGVQDLLFGKRVRRSITKSLAAGAATSLIAYVTDYYLVPKRFTPGFEKKLTGTSLGVIYGTMAVALAAGAYLRDA